jgi:hypothetical protein
MHDDSLRGPGSPYEQDEILAFMVVTKGATVDWRTSGSIPDAVLYVPETLFEVLAKATLLASVDQYGDTRLDARVCVELGRQLDGVLAGPMTAMAREGTALILARVRAVASGRDLELLIEGP